MLRGTRISDQWTQPFVGAVKEPDPGLHNLQVLAFALQYTVYKEVHNVNVMKSTFTQ